MRVEDMEVGGKYSLQSRQHDNGWYKIEILSITEFDIQVKILDCYHKNYIGITPSFTKKGQFFSEKIIVETSEELTPEAKAIKDSYEQELVNLHGYEMSTDFRKALIDIALMDGDRDWFYELTGGVKVAN